MLNKFWDFIFPPFCVACNRPGEWWCGKCRGGVHLVKNKICPRCLTIGEHECEGDLPFGEVILFGFYHDPKLRALITKLKFSGVTVLKSDLIAFLKAQNDVVIDAGAVLVPMPLASHRLKERGFNQAGFVAEVLSEAFGWSNVIDSEVLERFVHSDPQSSLEHDLALRSKHINGAFKVVKRPPAHVVLIDDVVTTGATAAEAVRTLKSAGAERVDLVTLAVGA